MNTYKIKLDIEVEVQAFNEDDATEYINDIFSLDDEIKSIKINSVREK